MDLALGKTSDHIWDHEYLFSWWHFADEAALKSGTPDFDCKIHELFMNFPHEF